jgi:hypothetical protein
VHRRWRDSWNLPVGSFPLVWLSMEPTSGWPTGTATRSRNSMAARQRYPEPHMRGRIDAQVLIVGGGPVGPTLAMDLAARHRGDSGREMIDRDDFFNCQTWSACSEDVRRHSRKSQRESTQPAEICGQ